MTKEETLRAEYGKLVVNPERVYEYNPTIIKAAHTSMEQYAKQVAIELGKFILDNRWKISEVRVDVWFCDKGDEDVNYHTTEELYQLFIEQQKNG